MRLYRQIRNNSICFKTITSASCSSFLDKTCLTIKLNINKIKVFTALSMRMSQLIKLANLKYLL